MVGRLNKTLIEMLSKVVAENQRDWDTKLGAVLWAYRTTKHATTGETPYTLVYGREPRLPVSAMYDIN